MRACSSPCQSRQIPHFETASSWKAARAKLTFQPREPGYTPGPGLIARRLRQRRPRPNNRWHLCRASALPFGSARGRNRFATDSPLEGSGFELLVPRCALIPNSATLVGPLDSAVSGGSLNGRLILQPRSVGAPATARLTPAARSELAVPKRLSPHCQINFSRAEGVPSGIGITLG